MRLYNSNTWKEDLDLEISQLEELKELNNKSILITGGTGLICSAVVDLLIRYNEKYGGSINIILAGRSFEKVKDRFLQYVEKDYFRFEQFDASEDNRSISIKCDYIIHGASNASPNKIVKEPVETMMSNFSGIKRLLESAKENETARVLYVSSSEVYGKKDGNNPYHEDEYGYIDLLNSRNSYSVAKRAAETLCVSYADEYGADTVIVRPGHIYGPTAMASDNRVSSVWPHSVVNGEDIIMKSDGSQIRSYCYCLDCASAILKILLLGEKNHAYNVSNPNSIVSIKEMAQILANAAGVKVRMEIPTEEERKGFNPMRNSSLDSSSLIKLGWKGLFDAPKGFAHTVRIIKESE